MKPFNQGQAIVVIGNDNDKLARITFIREGHIVDPKDIDKDLFGRYQDLYYALANCINQLSNQVNDNISKTQPV